MLDSDKGDLLLVWIARQHETQKHKRPLRDFQSTETAAEIALGSI
jgi:hypothetical protein